MRASSPARRALASCVLGCALASVAAAGACGGNPSASPTPADASADVDTGVLPPLEASPPAVVAAASRLDASSSTVVFDRLRGGVWTANGDVGSISYADIAHQKLLQEISIGQDVTSVALSPDFSWIAAVDRKGGAVALVDATTGTVKRTLALGTHPREAVWDAADPRWLYVSLEDAGAVAVVDRTLGMLNHTVPVGRLPAGLAVSRLRSELAVSHRIDATVTLLSTAGAYAPADQDPPLVEVPLATQPALPDPTQPNGQPFAFDHLAWAPDDDVVWLPHELLANHHPLQFQRDLFPAVSVVDLAARAEVQTNPDDPLGVIAGRKLLFGAIDIPDSDGNVSIVSQPCAAAFHPNGLTAFVVACASEDLLTFDLTSGVAVDLLRDLPGDHPTGIALDAAGARAFIVADQSHTLLTLDTAGGSPIGHATVIGGPLTLVAKDPVDPQLRAGLELFFSANSTKFSYATTGNEWMSCSGCHLDGFVSTNEFFFQAMSPLDPTQDAQIGHEGLKDMFSTAPTPASPSFDPHDILSAFLDQGGLAPDRTGADRTGQVDPSNPPAQAVTMAQEMGLVIAADLPQGPSWLLSDSEPDPSYDTSWCGNCHQAEYAAWQLSAHAHSAKDAMVPFGMGVEQQLRGPQYSRQCAGCHDPVSLRLGDSTLSSGRGITCLGCHDVTRLIRAGGNSDMETAMHAWTQDHVANGAASLAYLKTPDFCAVCHQQFVPGDGLLAIGTLSEWQVSPLAPPGPPLPEGGMGAVSTALLGDLSGPTTGPSGTTCVDCHMPANAVGVHDHSAPGGNVYVAQQFGEAAFAQTVTSKLASAITMTAVRAYDGDVDTVHAVVMNGGTGHAFPTGVTDIREPWVEVQELDAQGNVTGTFGGPDSTGLLPASAARFGMDIAAADGTMLYEHQLTEATTVPFQRMIPSRGSIEVVIPLPSGVPQTASLQAVLQYHNVRTPYYRAATGTTGSAPAVEVAHAVVGQGL